MGVAMLLCGLWFLYHVRNTRFVGDLLENTPLSLVVVLAVFVSVLRGLMQKGLRFDPSDVEYLFVGPFSERALLIYRLLPSYLSAFGGGILIYGLFHDRFEMPLLSVFCLLFTHLLSIHLTSIASLISGTLSEDALSKLRKGFCVFGGGILFVMLRAELGAEESFAGEPSLWRSAIRETGFWSMSDPSTMARWALRAAEGSIVFVPLLSIPRNALLLLLSVLVLMGLIMWSLSLLMNLRSAIFEPNLKAVKSSDGCGPARASAGFLHRVAISRLGWGAMEDGWFFGARALIWKNLVCVRRSLPSLLLGLGYTLLVVVPWLPILLMMRSSGSFDPWAVNGALPLTLAALPLLLQTTVAFDFRLDGHQLGALKRLPLGDVPLVVSVIIVPVTLCVGFQYLGLALFLWMSPFDWGILLAMVLGFPAVSLGVIVVWNLHYLLFANQRFGNSGRPAHRSTVGALFVVGIAFSVFFPSCWLLHSLVHRFEFPGVFAAFFALVLQVGIDALLVCLLARVYSRANEIGRQSVG